jgi:transcriptional regulator with PAS, ATPase and Fis domain
MTQKKETKKREIVGVSNNIQEVRQKIKSIAKEDTIVLILGATGTGKELVANNIRNKSERKDKPFEVVNCAAIPSELLESELFGHEKGAFTGAAEKKIGKFELANGGTILLDEIGDMRLDHQTKILRVLQDRKIQPIGGSKSMDVDVRIIASTNRDLSSMINKGEFREDLYYRLSREVVRLKPLADRTEDVICLTNHFIYENRTGRKADHRVKFLLYAYDWPGNVRELETMIQHINDLKYVKEELEIKWKSQKKDSGKTDKSEDEIDRFLETLRSTEEEDKDEFMETINFVKRTDVDFKKYVEIYEIIMLNSCIKKNEICRVLHLKRDKVFNFKHYYGFELELENDLYLVYHPLDVYPQPKTLRNTFPNIISSNQ